MNTIDEILGFSPEEATEIKESPRNLPALVIPKEPEKTICSLVEELPRTIEVKDMTTGGRKQVPVITVEDGQGIKFTLWLSNESAKRQFLQIYNQAGGKLKGKKIAIWKSEKEHPKFKRLVAYTRMQLM
ncbi:MAG: hypothetical protein NT129_00885 [Candidatus Aenigmarchaeota archaeon]|nr:hypothetical protein [Candidatus Aenigmarchaeota archaeon]